MTNRDPYKCADVDVLKNKLNIKDLSRLEEAESIITTIKLVSVDNIPNKNFDYQHLMQLHKHIFGELYEWAGVPRIINMEKPEKVLAGQSVKYSDHSLIKKEMTEAIKELKSINYEKLPINQQAEQFSKKIADLWKVHPFREGNTRTVLTFGLQYLESKGISINRELLKNHSAYVRTSLALSSIGEYSEYQHLTKIIKDALEKSQITNENTLHQSQPIEKSVSIPKNQAPLPGNLDLDHLFQINKSVNSETSFTHAIRAENIKGLVPPFIVIKKASDVLRDIRNSNILNSGNKELFAEQAATHLNNFNKVQLFSTNNVETSKEFFRSLAGTAGFKMDMSKIDSNMFQTPVNGSLTKVIENISNAIENIEPSREIQQSFQNQNKLQYRNQQMQQEHER